MLASRRGLLALGPAAFLAACAVSKQGNITTITIDTARVDRDGTAIIAAMTAMLAAPSLVTALGPVNMALAQTAAAAAQAALKQFDADTKGSLALSADTTKAQTLVSSIIADAQTVLTLVAHASPSLPVAVRTQVGDYTSAILALLPFLQAAVGLANVGNPSLTSMTESDAVRICHQGK